MKEFLFGLRKLWIKVLTANQFIYIISVCFGPTQLQISPENLKFKWQYSQYLELNPNCEEA